MSGNEEKPGTGKSGRSRLILMLAGALVFAMALGAVSAWLVVTFVIQPNRVVIVMPAGAPAAAVMTPGQTVLPGAVLPEARATAPRPAAANSQSRTTVSGNVTDAVTHQAVGAFSVRLGYQNPLMLSSVFAQAGQDFTGGQFRMTGTRLLGMNARYAMQIDAAGKFRVRNVVPGNYALIFNVQPAQGPRRGATQVPFTMPNVPGGVSDEPLVIPDVTIRVN